MYFIHEVLKLLVWIIALPFIYWLLRRPDVETVIDMFKV